MPQWIPDAAIRAIHDELIREHGGLQGPVDDNALGATLGRPQQLVVYGDPPPTLTQLAAAYGFGFSKNHCFKDGNKRIALVAIDVFLQINDYKLVATEPDAVAAMLAVAAGEMSENALADWIQANMQALSEE